MYTHQELEAILTALIERGLYEGVGNLTRKYVLAGTKGNIIVAKTCLEKWAAEGKCRILKPIENAQDDENIVTMLSYISKPIPWPAK